MQKKGISIRFACLDDWPKIVKLATAMHAESRFSKLKLDEQKLRNIFLEQLSSPRVACCLLAYKSDGIVVGMLVGFVTEFFFTRQLVAQDRVFFVLPEYRGTSAAVRLLTAFRKWAENRNVQELNINMSVAVDMPRFERFMTHMGFAKCGTNFFYQMR
ncbi:N-acetyltransferase family protein [Limnohabitans sp.]|uniref:GNAT family N-acetyltransferase n=1 Tax=Limnohabitans sp. TaxID=1907725 RepID=UPI0038BDF273